MTNFENQKKFMKDCLDILIEKLILLQHELLSEFWHNSFLHNKLITVCRKIFIYRFACYKSFESLIDFINDIRFFIITFNKTHQIETFFTDRKYHENKKRFQNYSINQRRFRYFFDRLFRRYDRVKKICFVCKKKNY